MTGQSPLESENSRLAVKRIFQGISLYLKEKKLQPPCLGGCQGGNQKGLALHEQVLRKIQEIKNLLILQAAHLVSSLSTFLRFKV